MSLLGIHEAVHVADLTLPEGVRPVGDGSQTLVTVLPPTVEEAKPAAEAAEAVPAEGAAAEAAPASTPEGGAPAGSKKGGGEGRGGEG